MTGDTPTAAIEVQDLIRVYQDGDVETIALRGIDLRIEHGEFVAIHGRSGSGKSTLLNILAGADQPTAGKVRINGTAIEHLEEPELARLRGRTVGIVFQSGNLADFLTLEESLELSARLAGRDPTGARARLEMVGLQDRAHHRPAQLSGGEQQRAAVAMVLAAEPRILLGDEITGELDSGTADLLLDLLADFHARNGVTVVLVSHDRAVAERARRVIELRDGRVVADSGATTAAMRLLSLVQPGATEAPALTAARP
jgi:ABC-type lipoprotein export system ATPase subunit